MSNQNLPPREISRGSENFWVAIRIRLNNDIMIMFPPILRNVDHMLGVNITTDDLDTSRGTPRITNTW
ncbi:hypothetical protein Glove_130g12 [Diversispora epigaea]|uniref:Uncharacterized protein n=1 Tax=Diversispora epigaea TaxID=1348612 RepID=A0A397J2N0_9GLOM|nr:hypothetical protein Glove_130g12 [Diversispora epigaea]